MEMSEYTDDIKEKDRVSVFRRREYLHLVWINCTLRIRGFLLNFDEPHRKERPSC